MVKRVDPKVNKPKEMKIQQPKPLPKPKPIKPIKNKKIKKSNVTARF